MTWVKKVGTPCLCHKRPDIELESVQRWLLDDGIGPGSQWQCDELDCSKLWEIKLGPYNDDWHWVQVHPTGLATEAEND